MIKPFGWMQWHGTNLCMDVHCECGELHHVDGRFAYVVKTPCGRYYRLNSDVPLEAIPEPSADEQERAVECIL